VSAVDDAIALLEQRKRDLRGSELIALLQSFGFRVRDCKKVGHKQVSHGSLEGFFGASFTAGHGADDQVKPVYVGKMIALLKTYQEELEKLMEAP
jgi:hypothetical protein